VPRFARPQFSLATLLIAMAWSAVVVWINTLPRVTLREFPGPGISATPTPSKLVGWHPSYIPLVTWGWPCGYRTTILNFRPPRTVSAGALFTDAGVGLLLVVVLTWTSSLLLRRAGSRLRRRPQETKL
jgi:hypothetical protein